MRARFTAGGEERRAKVVTRLGRGPARVVELVEVSGWMNSDVNAFLRSLERRGLAKRRSIIRYHSRLDLWSLVKPQAA